jgi:hypothetical protein
MKVLLHASHVFTLSAFVQALAEQLSSPAFAAEE